MPTWPDTVTFIKNGEEGDQDTLNQPLTELTARTDYLKTRLDAWTNKSNLVAYKVATTADVEEGDLVYFDASCSSYARALAAWSGSYAARGELLASDEAYVKGVVLTKHSTSLADVLLDGLYSDQTLADAMLGPSAEPGLYYLSAVDPGSATPEPPPLKVPAVTYLGDGSFIFKASDVFQPNHLHRSALLAENWLDASDPAFDGMAAPEGAVTGYDIDSDPEFREWFAAYPGELTVVVDGLVQAPGVFRTTESNLWYVGEMSRESSSSSEGYESDSTSSTSDSSASASSSSEMGADWPSGAESVVAYAYSPLIAGEPVLRTAGTDTPCELGVEAVNGKLVINAMPWSSVDAPADGKAVTGVVGKTLRRAPAVSGITSSGGLKVVAVGNGVYDVSAGDVVESTLDAELVNLDNVIELTDDPYFYYNFPKDRNASIMGRISMPSLSPANTYKAAVWVYRRGVIGATAGAPVDFPAISVEMTHLASPRGTSSVVIPVTTGLTTTLPVQSASVEADLYYAETPETDRLEVSSEGTLYIKLSMGSDAYDKYITRFGALIYLDSGDDPVVPPCGA